MPSRSKMNFDRESGPESLTYHGVRLESLNYAPQICQEQCRMR
jgi:hypothetical protein